MHSLNSKNKHCIIDLNLFFFVGQQCNSFLLPQDNNAATMRLTTPLLLDQHAHGHTDGRKYTCYSNGMCTEHKYFNSAGWKKMTLAWCCMLLCEDRALKLTFWNFILQMKIKLSNSSKISNEWQMGEHKYTLTQISFNSMKNPKGLTKKTKISDTTQVNLFSQSGSAHNVIAIFWLHIRK